MVSSANWSVDAHCKFGTMPSAGEKRTCISHLRYVHCRHMFEILCWAWWEWPPFSFYITQIRYFHVPTSSIPDGRLRLVRAKGRLKTDQLLGARLIQSWMASRIWRYVYSSITNVKLKLRCRQRFAPVKEVKTKTPTVTMLSHIW
jgi:hypothetical protein